MSMNEYRQWYLFRWAAWAMIWAYIHPEMLTIKGWAENHNSVIPGVLTYLVTGAILEICYRMLVWGRMYPNEQFIPTVAPDCPDNQWISLSNDFPQKNEMNIEVFCADGRTRNGFLVEASRGGGIGVALESAEYGLLLKAPWKYRATHWRYIKSAQ